MLNLNKCTKSKPKPRTAHVCAYHCAQLSYTTQHRTVLIIFPLILQTIIIAQTMATGGEGDNTQQKYMNDNAKHTLHRGYTI